MPKASPTIPAHSTAAPPGESLRDSVEAVVVAIILTLTFRTFLGENYQIPTGSMAPTLQGRHMDVVCPECRYQYRTGASQENPDNGPMRSEVIATTCPLCRYRLDLDKRHDLNQRSFGGDRIIVSKLAYLFQEPERWDVFVFKYPGNPKINYIKRLVGLPGETIRIRHGDVHVAPAVTSPEAELPPFHIARKPADKVVAMLQPVDDTYYLSESLQAIGWPLRWTPLETTGQTWQVGEETQPLIQIVQPTPETTWLAYRHIVPQDGDWRAIVQGGDPELQGLRGQLITDYYAYNESSPNGTSDCLNWVGDLAVEAHAEVLSDSGELFFDLIEGGIHHQCRIDVATGQATLTLDSGNRPFEATERNAAEANGAEGAPAQGNAPQRTGSTPIRGRGSYEVRFANVDDQLFLWVNGKLIGFDGPTTFESPSDLAPKWSPEDPGDFRPVRVGARQAAVRLDRLQVFRDVYYIATTVTDHAPDSDYSIFWAANPNAVLNVLSDPTTWAETEMFASRQEVLYTLGPDQFFPMGDNSPQSKDGRLWSHVTDQGFEPPPYVRREMLIGKAVFVYWPHGWRFFTDWVGFIPNFQRIGLIR